MKQLAYYVDEDLHREVKVQAYKKGKTITSFVVEALKEKLEKEKQTK